LIEIPKEEFDELDEAIGEMNLEYSNARDFIHSQIDAVLEEYKRFKEEREKMEKEQEEETGFSYNQFRKLKSAKRVRLILK